MSGVQALVVKSDQEVSIVDVKNSLIGESRRVEGLMVMPEESTVGASAANAVTERSVWGDAEHHESDRCVRVSGCTTPCLNQAALFWHRLWSSQDRWSPVSKKRFRM